MTHEVMTRGLYDFPALAPVYALGRSAVNFRAACPDLDDNEDPAVAAHEIDFTSAAAITPLEDRETAGSKKASGFVLPFEALRLGRRFHRAPKTSSEAGLDSGKGGVGTGNVGTVTGRPF